jgi:hypothetical protein
MIEWVAWRVLDLHKPFSQTLAVHFNGPVMAERIVARFSEERVGRPRAATQAHLRVVAVPAESPQIIHRARSSECQGATLKPDLL